MSGSRKFAEGRMAPFGGFVKILRGDAAMSSSSPRSGHDVTTGFTELDKLRAEHNGWSDENTPRLERIARVVKFDAR
jgi:hypothetical protein